MPTASDRPLSSEEVFRSFWIMCVTVADLVHAYGSVHPGELQCSWRRHSLVITCLDATLREIGLQRRKNLAFCVVASERCTLWQGHIVPNSSGEPIFSTAEGTVGIEAAAAVLFRRIMTFLNKREPEIARAARA